MERRCPTCKRTLPIDSFYRNPEKKDGLFATCKDCCNARRKKRKPRMEHKEGTKECMKCKQTKPYEFFGTNKHKADGYHYYCKACTRADREKYLKKNKEIDYASFYLPVNYY